MQKMFEAIWHDGKIIPRESVDIREQSHLFVIVIDEKTEAGDIAAWRNLKGKYKGKLSTADEFIRCKQEEKRLEK